MKPWPIKKLGEVCEIISPGIKEFEGKKRYVATADIEYDKIINFTEITYKSRPHRANVEVEDNDVLVAKMAQTLKLLLATKEHQKDYIFSTGFAVLRAKNEQLIPQYLFYYFTTKDFNLQKDKFAVGATQKAINHQALKKIKAPLSPLNIQHQIVERLDAIRKAQELNDKQIALADEFFQSLLYKELHPEEKKWEIKKLWDLCEKIEQSHPRKNFKNKFRYIDISSIDSNTKDVRNTELIDIEKAPSRARKLVKAKDVLFATTRPYLEHIALVSEDLDKSVCSTGFCVIRANNNLTIPEFLYFTVITKPFIRKILVFQRGANYPAVSDKDVYNRKIFLPPLKTQHQIVEKLQAVQDYKKKLFEQKQKLQELFSSCLDKAMKRKLVN